MTTRKDAQARGRLIARTRKAKGYSQDQVASFVGVTRAALSDWENGKVLDLQPEKAFELAILLEIPKEKLVTDFVMQQIAGGVDTPANLIKPIHGLVSVDAERIAMVWDRIDDDDPVKKLIAEVIDRLAVTSPHQSKGH